MKEHDPNKKYTEGHFQSNSDFSNDYLLIFLNQTFFLLYFFAFYLQELKLYAKPYELSKDEKFGEVYHTLIHSPALETLLNLEHEYSLGVEQVIRKRDQDLRHLLEK